MLAIRRQVTAFRRPVDLDRVNNRKQKKLHTKIKKPNFQPFFLRGNFERTVPRGIIFQPLKRTVPTTNVVQIIYC